MVYGTDLLGTMRRRQLDEFAIRGEIIPAIDVLRAATCNGADMLGRSGELGEVIAGAHADLLVMDGDPLADLSGDDRARSEPAHHHEGRRDLQEQLDLSAGLQRAASSSSS